MKKKIISCALIGALSATMLFSIASCSGSDDNTETTSESTVASETTPADSTNTHDNYLAAIQATYNAKNMTLKETIDRDGAVTEIDSYVSETAVNIENYKVGDTKTCTGITGYVFGDTSAIIYKGSAYDAMTKNEEVAYTEYYTKSAYTSDVILNLLKNSNLSDWVGNDQYASAVYEGNGKYTISFAAFGATAFYDITIQITNGYVTAFSWTTIISDTTVKYSAVFSDFGTTSVTAAGVANPLSVAGKSYYGGTDYVSSRELTEEEKKSLQNFTDYRLEFHKDGTVDFTNYGTTETDWTYTQTDGNIICKKKNTFSVMKFESDGTAIYFKTANLNDATMKYTFEEVSKTNAAMNGLNFGMTQVKDNGNLTTEEKNYIVGNNYVHFDFTSDTAVNVEIKNTATSTNIAVGEGTYKTIGNHVYVDYNKDGTDDYFFIYDSGSLLSDSILLYSTATVKTEVYQIVLVIS